MECMPGEGVEGTLQETQNIVVLRVTSLQCRRQITGGNCVIDAERQIRLDSLSPANVPSLLETVKIPGGCSLGMFSLFRIDFLVPYTLESQSCLIAVL